MCYVVNKETEMILNRCDAWEINSVGKMQKWAESCGGRVHFQLYDRP